MRGRSGLQVRGVGRLQVRGVGRLQVRGALASKVSTSSMSPQYRLRACSTRAPGLRQDRSLGPASPPGMSGGTMSERASPEAMLIANTPRLAHSPSAPKRRKERDRLIRRARRAPVEGRVVGGPASASSASARGILVSCARAL